MLNEDQIFAKEKIRQLLQTNVVELTFIKKDGTKRVMNCTLDPKRMPEVQYSDNPHKINEDVLPVWDIDKKGWRSFRIESIDMYLVKRMENA